MSLERPIQKASEATERAVQSVKSKISILPDKEVCPDCNSVMEATWTYDPQQAAFFEETGGKAPSWECGNCGKAIRRKEKDVVFDPFE